MGKIVKKDQTVAEMLVTAQGRHAKRLKKVEHTLTRFEKQRRQLTALEAELAVLADRAATSALVGRGQSSRGTSAGAQTLVIVNPKAKCLAAGTVSVEAIVQALRMVGIRAEVGLKTSGKVARQLVRAAVKRGAPLVVVAAGDGTIEAVAAELVGSDTTLGILPMGTMNNLAHALGVPLDLAAACLLLAMRTTRHIDIGRVVTAEHSHKAYFLETAGVGLSALAAPLGQAIEKGRWAALFGLLDRFFAFQATQLSLAIDEGERLQAETQMVTLSNVPLSGNHMLIAPQAKIDDGWLDLAVYPGMDKGALQRYFLGISNGKRVEEPRVHFQRVRRVQITASEPLAAHTDLDVFAEQPTWTFEVIPHALSVVVGNGIALTLPVVAAPAAPPLAGPQAPPKAAGS